MALLKKNTSSLSFVVAALIVVMAATLLISSCDARKVKDKPTAFLVAGKCFSRFFPNCTEQRCKKFCVQPLPGAVCIDKTHCCCPIA
ncbi:unnamed protein product [Triticum turgidum subsp. durum]|uniref:Defensin n=1 Tax=Triticum turgidum subsp. durum TaxID=4567 RepID=A0A9R1Q900_TRITD|nr:unnamed protein product [Triticum turgidum subsp. durum]